MKSIFIYDGVAYTELQSAKDAANERLHFMTNDLVNFAFGGIVNEMTSGALYYIGVASYRGLPVIALIREVHVK